MYNQILCFQSQNFLIKDGLEMIRFMEVIELNHSDYPEILQVICDDEQLQFEVNLTY